MTLATIYGKTAITQNYRCEGNWVIMGTPFSLKLGPRH
jgi:hypothetical protein